MHRNTIGYIEQASREPTLTTLLRLVASLRWTAAELFGEVEREMAPDRLVTRAGSAHFFRRF